MKPWICAFEKGESINNPMSFEREGRTKSLSNNLPIKLLYKKVTPELSFLEVSLVSKIMYVQMPFRFRELRLCHPVPESMKDA